MKKGIGVVDPDVVNMLRRQLPLWEKLEALKTESGPSCPVTGALGIWKMKPADARRLIAEL